MSGRHKKIVDLHLEIEHLRARLTEAERERERLKDIVDHDQCTSCAGTGKPISGLPCMCKGTGKMSEAAYTLLEELVKAERERDNLIALSGEVLPACSVGTATTLPSVIQKSDADFPLITIESDGSEWVPYETAREKLDEARDKTLDEVLAKFRGVPASMPAIYVRDAIAAMKEGK